MWANFVNALRLGFVLLCVSLTALGILLDDNELKLIGFTISMALIISAIHNIIVRRRRR